MAALFLTSLFACAMRFKNANSFACSDSAYLRAYARFARAKQTSVLLGCSAVMFYTPTKPLT